MDRQSVLALVLQILLISAESESQPEAPSSWPATDVIHLSPLAVKSMPYRDFRIKFYRRQNDLIYDVSRSAGENQQPASIGDVRYFYTPIGSLDHRSAVSYHNNVTGESELRFVIHLWDDELEDTIAEYLKNVLKTPVRKEDLEVIPFQRIYLELNTKLQEFVHFESRKAWTHYYVQERYIWPRMKCPSTMDCNKMAEQMRLNPTQFSDCFQLKFLMESQQRSTQLLKKEISIEASSLVLGRLYSQVESKFQRQNYVLLTPLDTRQLIFESVNKIISQNFDDGAVVDDSNMYASLEQLLVPSKQNMNGQPKNPSDGGWDLLYWDQDDNYRPDKLAAIINQIYNLSDSNGKRKLIEVFRLKSDRSKSYSDADLSSMFEKFAFTVGDFLQRIEVVEEPTTDDYDYDVVKVTKVAEDEAPLPSFKREMMTSEALFSQSGFHVIPDQINQTKSDWDAEFSDILEEHNTLALKMLMASGNVMKWTGKEFVLKPQKFSKLNLAKLRGRQTDSRAMFKISVPYLEADMVMNPKIDFNFYWTPERDLKVRLQDALLIVEEKFKQVKSKMTSNYTALVNDREKEIVESTAARLHDALLAVDEKFHQMEFKMKSNYTAMTSNYTALVNDREKGIVESTAARLHDALLAVDEKFQQVEFKMESNYTVMTSNYTKLVNDREKEIIDSTAVRLQDALRIVDDKFQQVETKVTANYTTLVSDREKEIVDLTASRLQDALLTVDEKFHQMEFKMKSNYTDMTSNYTALVNDREKGIVESTAARLHDALLAVDEKFQQVEFKMTSNYTGLISDREKEIIESTAARLHDALLVVDEKFQLVEFKMASNYTVMTSNYTKLVNDREKEIIDSTAVRLQDALRIVDDKFQQVETKVTANYTTLVSDREKKIVDLTASRLQDALLAVDEKFQQLELQMASNYTEIRNVRQKMLHDYTTRHEALEGNTSKKINELHHLVEQEVSNLGNQTNRQFSEQTAIRNALIQSVERRQAIALQLSNEAHDDSLRRLRAQVNRGAKLGRMPSSCRDLWTIGHSHTGYYIVKSNNIKHPIEILYCDMAERGNASSSSALQRDYSRADSNEKWIGYSDVKTSSVYFYAQRLTTFSQQGAPVPFQAEILNTGGAFRLSDGTFSVPTPGVYHFSFSGLRAAANHFVHVTLQVNGKRFGSAYSGTPESNKVSYRPTSLSLQSVLELRRGDQVRLFLEAGAIGAETPCQDCVHFSGMLLTEYL